MAMITREIQAMFMPVYPTSSGENATVVAGTGPAGWAQVEPRGPQMLINV